MNSIKKYEKLYQITLRDGEIVYIEAGENDINKKKIVKDYTNPELLSIQIGDRFISKKNIKDMKRYTITNSIEEYIFSLSKDLKAIVKRREEEKRQRVGRGFESVEEIQNYLQTHLGKHG